MPRARFKLFSGHGNSVAAVALAPGFVTAPNDAMLTTLSIAA